MKFVVQRVLKASVKSEGKIVGKIKSGLFVLVGIRKGDDIKKADELINKLLKLRIVADQNKKMNLSILDSESDVLFVSQFTLLANTKDGNRPSFVMAEDPDRAKWLYGYMVDNLKESGLNIQTGSFGNYMEIEAVLDGPVTIVLEN
jgi:D-tyrosyl-tRNA(Tyr) deacylase